MFQDLSIEEQSECTQDFYQTVAERMQTRGKGDALLARRWGIAGGWLHRAYCGVSSRFSLSLKAWLVCPLGPINSTDILVVGLRLSSVFDTTMYIIPRESSN